MWQLLMPWHLLLWHYQEPYYNQLPLQLSPLSHISLVNDICLTFIISVLYGRLCYIGLMQSNIFVTWLLFTKILTKDTLYLLHYGEIWTVFHEFIASATFCTCHSPELSCYIQYCVMIGHFIKSFHYICYDRPSLDVTSLYWLCSRQGPVTI